MKFRWQTYSFGESYFAGRVHIAHVYPVASRSRNQEYRASINLPGSTVYIRTFPDIAQAKETVELAVAQWFAMCHE